MALRSACAVWSERDVWQGYAGETFEVTGFKMSSLFLSPMLRRKNILGNSHENAEELERANEMKEKEAAL